MRSLIVRRFIESDAAELLKIIRRNFMEVNINDYPEDTMVENCRNFSEERLIRLGEKAHFYVACHGGEIAGCGAISMYFDSDDQSSLRTIFVKPELHGMGIGTAIMKALESDELFFGTSRTEIPSSITAIEFYMKFGYKFKNGNSDLDESGHYKLEKFR